MPNFDQDDARIVDVHNRINLDPATIEGRRAILKADKRASLVAAFLEAGENLAHYLADSENRVETAWDLRGLIETLALGADGARKRSLDAGLYVSDYRRGVKSAVLSGLDLA